MRELPFDFDGSGQWEATSAILDDDGPRTYRIGVCDDGTFTLGDSSPALGLGKQTYPTLQDAKNAANKAERDALAEISRRIL